MLSDDGQLSILLQLVSRHVIEIQEIGFKKFGTELRSSLVPRPRPAFRRLQFHSRAGGEPGKEASSGEWLAFI